MIKSFSSPSGAVVNKPKPLGTILGSYSRLVNQRNLKITGMPGDYSSGATSVRLTPW